MSKSGRSVLLKDHSWQWCAPVADLCGVVVCGASPVAQRAGFDHGRPDRTRTYDPRLIKAVL